MNYYTGIIVLFFIWQLLDSAYSNNSKVTNSDAIFNSLSFHFFMTGNCSNNEEEFINVGDIFTKPDTSSGILELKLKQTKADCAVILRLPDKETGLVISVTQVEFESSSAKLVINDGNTTMTLTNSTTTMTGEYVFISQNSGVPVTINFTYDELNSSHSHSFQLLYTAYIRSGDCENRNEFLCNNGFCTADELRCDGFNHCGDYSDQDGCYTDTAKGLSRTDGYIIGCVCAIMALLCSIVIFIKIRNYKIQKDKSIAIMYYSP